MILKIKIKNKRYSKILYVESIYSLSLYNYYNNNNLDDTLIISSKGVFPLRLIDGFTNYIELNNNLDNVSRIEYIMLSHGFLPNRFKSIKKYLYKNAEYYGHDHIKFSALFFKKNMILVEDGTKNYFYKKRIKDIFWRFLGVPFPLMGYSDNVKSIIMTGLMDIPEKIKNKVLLIDKDNYLKSLPLLNNGLYTCDYNEESYFTLIITQPLSEDKIISEKEKIDLYRRYVEKESNHVVIKSHPRERTKYGHYFEDATILDPTCLVESLVYNEKLKKVITVRSTAIESFYKRDDIEIIKININKYCSLIDFFGG